MVISLCWLSTYCCKFPALFELGDGHAKLTCWLNEVLLIVTYSQVYISIVTSEIQRIPTEK